MVMNSLCIYFSASTALFCAADALQKYGVPYNISRFSRNLATDGCTRCLKISPLNRSRAVSAMSEYGCRWLEIREVSL